MNANSIAAKWPRSVLEQLDDIAAREHWESAESDQVDRLLRDLAPSNLKRLITKDPKATAELMWQAIALPSYWRFVTSEKAMMIGDWKLIQKGARAFLSMTMKYERDITTLLISTRSGKNTNRLDEAKATFADLQHLVRRIRIGAGDFQAILESAPAPRIPRKKNISSAVTNFCVRQLSSLAIELCKEPMNPEIARLVSVSLQLPSQLTGEQVVQICRN